jgi:hypothetical protein
MLMETMEKACLLAKKAFRSRLVQRTGDIAIAIIGIAMLLLMLWAFIPKSAEQPKSNAGSITAKTAAKTLLRAR